MRVELEFAGALIARGSAAVGGVLLSLMIARFTGSEGLGQFTLYLSFLGLFVIFSRRGSDFILLRSVARSFRSGRGDRLAALLFSSGVTTFLTALMLSPLGAMLLVSGVLGQSIPGGAWGFLFSLPMLTLLSIVAAYMKGVGQTWLAPFFEMGGVSLGASCLLGILLLLEFSITPASSGVLFTVALAVFCFPGLLWVTRHAARRRAPSTPLHLSEEERFMLAKGRIPLTIVVLSNFLVQAGSFVIVAPFLSDADLGLVRAAERLALVVSFPILAIDPMIAARIAGLVHSGKLESLRRLIKKAVLAGVVIAFPPLLVMLFFPDILLSFIGSEFEAATPYLRLLALTHFVLVLLGPFSMVLAMSGREREMMWVSGVALVTAIVLYPLLTAWFGVYGFIMGYMVTSVGRSLAIGILAIASVGKNNAKIYRGKKDDNNSIR